MSTRQRAKTRSTSKNKSKELYSSDYPITSKGEDKFNRWPFAERIAQTIARRKESGSLVIGIYGPWGDGKTSVLNLMEEAFKSYDNVILIRFNPWHFQSQDQLIRGFFGTLADALGKSLPTKVEEVGRILNKYGSILSLASVSFFGGAAQVTPGAGLQDLGKQLSTVELGELRTRLEGILREAEKRPVVLIDDIDRLDRQEIQAIFKLIKLSAGFENTSYVLAFDDEVVADSLGEKYGSGGPEAGRNFLEKIVQVPLHLPPADQLSLRQLTFAGVDSALRLSGIELTQEQAQAFARHFVDGLERRLVTPRQAKRYANALTFALPLLKGEVHPVDQMLVEGLRVFYPSLYLVIRENPDVFLGTGYSGFQDVGERKKRALAVVTGALEGLAEAEQKAAKDLLQVLFPRLKGVFGNAIYGSDSDERWEREQRISSDSYFHRYFQYTIPARDIGDQLVARFFQMAEAADEETIGNELKRLARNGSAARLVEKLRRRERTVAPSAAITLARVVARLGEIFPVEQGPLVLTSTREQAAIFISRLIQQIPAGHERVELAQSVIREAYPLSFALQCLRWIRTPEDKSESEQIVPANIEEELGKTLADRVRNVTAQEPPYLAFADGSPGLIWIWKKYGAPGEVEAYLKARFTANPTETLRFLVSYVATAWGLESGLSRKADFRRESYDSVVQVIDPEVILDHLRSIYGAEVDPAEDYTFKDVPVEERIAHQFAAIHRGVKASSETGDAMKKVE